MTAPIPAMIVYCRLRYAWAPSWIALAISFIRSLPSGCRRTQKIRIDGEEERHQTGCSDGQQDGAIKGRHALRSPQDSE